MILYVILTMNSPLHEDGFLDGALFHWMGAIEDLRPT